MKEGLGEVVHPFLSKILRWVSTLHRHGRTHGHIRQRHILVHRESPVLIDLEFSEPHICGLQIRTIPGFIAPSVEEHGCPELHSLLCRTGVWQPCALHISSLCLYSTDQQPDCSSMEYISTRSSLKMSATSCRSFRNLPPQRNER
ncbi:hypothetical protein C8R46DRAFT_1074224 [Mycena filopes]|nr:hypothetical protein C8R46DRAFT_1074224 [Mycena filopes]